MYVSPYTTSNTDIDIRTTILVFRANPYLLRPPPLPQQIRNV